VSERTTLPYGSWPSPVTAQLIASSSIRLSSVATDGADIYWVEGRPTEGGRMVIVRLRGTDGTMADVTPAPLSARTRANEYGGGAYCVRNGVVYCNNDADGRVYALSEGAAPRPLTPEGAFHHADFDVDERHSRLICIREDRSASAANPLNAIVAVPLDGSMDTRVLVSGADFYSNPRVSADGASMCWLSWEQPDMPWDASTLSVAPLDLKGMPDAFHVLAGGPGVSVFQPQWGPDNTLFFVDDHTGWWNLQAAAGTNVRAITALAAEVGLAQWNFGMTVYDVHPNGSIVYAVCERGAWSLVHIRQDGSVHPLQMPFTDFGASLRFSGDEVVATMASPTTPMSVIAIDLADASHRMLRQAADIPLGDEWFSPPEPIEFPTDGDLTAHAFYHPPRNPACTAPAGDRPPLIIHSHGGPTSAASAGLGLGDQYWTSRGFGVVDVNYGGSTGFGRVYRERLNGQWGIVDVQDCINAAQFLVRRGDVDAERLAIAGGSAGGFTTLAALTFHDDLDAGVSSFGVADLAALAEDTHKFEARYLDRLVAPWPSGRAVYEARSPINHAEQLSCPVLLLQGLEDRIVPPAQAERMLAAMRERGIPCAYVPFAGEQHGWRRAETIQRALEAELSFYAQVFGFVPAGVAEPVEIENLGALRR